MTTMTHDGYLATVELDEEALAAAVEDLDEIKREIGLLEAQREK